MSQFSSAVIRLGTYLWLNFNEILTPSRNLHDYFKILKCSIWEENLIQVWEVVMGKSKVKRFICSVHETNLSEIFRKSWLWISFYNAYEDSNVQLRLTSFLQCYGVPVPCHDRYWEPCCWLRWQKTKKFPWEEEGKLCLMRESGTVALALWYCFYFNFSISKWEQHSSRGRNPKEEWFCICSRFPSKG